MCFEMVLFESTIYVFVLPLGSFKKQTSLRNRDG